MTNSRPAGLTAIGALPLISIVLSAAGCAAPVADAAPQDGCASVFARRAAPAIVDRRLATATRRLCLGTFAVLHSGVTRGPLWSAEHLTRASVASAAYRDQRDNRFHAETALPDDERSEIGDYVRSGFDRGHMAPSGDMPDAAEDHESFSLANVVPQSPRLNRGSWAAMESYVRRLTASLGETYVVTGPLFEGATVRRIGGRVLVPTSTWKAIWVPGRGAGAWIVTNTDNPRWRIVSIDGLVAASGVDPFPALEAAGKRQVPSFPDFGNTRRRKHGAPAR